MNEDLRPDPRLERHLLGETPKHLAESTKKALESPEAASKLQALQASNEAILAALPPERIAQAIRQRAATQPARQRGWMTGLVMAGLALGMSAGVFLFLEPSPTEGPVAVTPPRSDSSRVAHADSNASDSVHQPPTPEIVRRKDSLPGPKAPVVAAGGSPEASDTASWEVAWADDDILLKGKSRRLALHRIAKANAEALRLSNGDSASAGDLLQVGTLAGPKRFVAILSLDGNGQITRHLPESGDSSVLVSSKLQAPHSYQLDDAPKFERFVLIESRAPFDLASAEALLKKGSASGSLQRKGLRFESILLVKKP
ncbi:MAG: hypothetical protein IPO40_15540 [Fibrobacteres bacterium]|nr:hypothetical protein [Fibrobacterota bacterium]